MDPLKVLTIVGGAGGTLYWIDLVLRFVDRIRNRARLSIRFKKLEAHGVGGRPTVTFEAENRGGETMSLEPRFTMSGCEPLDGSRWSYVFEFDAVNRNLPPHSPKDFEATAKRFEVSSRKQFEYEHQRGSAASRVFSFLWYRQYKFEASRGRSSRVRFRFQVSGRPDDGRVRGPRFLIERYAFRLGFGRRLLIGLAKRKLGPKAGELIPPRES